MRFVFAASLAGATGAHATSVETLLMPGKVANAHAKLEEVCSNCHDRTNRVRQSELCLACHKPIAADVRTHTGYHGRMPNAAAGKCVGCHTEHQGREGDIVRLDKATFDHALTNFPLLGAHRALDCLSCHKAGEAFRKAEPNCIACHKKDDYHGGQLGNKCADCHNNDSWTGAHFDHGKTKFSLTGAHQSVSCGGCHLGGRERTGAVRRPHWTDPASAVQIAAIDRSGTNKEGLSHERL